MMHSVAMSMSASEGGEGPMSVIKRDGSRVPVQFDKVLERIRKAALGLSTAVNYTRLAQLVLAEIHDGVHTTELDELAARLAVSFVSVHPDWGTLASEIILSNCQRSSPATFSDAMELLGETRIAADVLEFIRANKEILNGMIVHKRDFLLDYFGFKTLEKGYLMRGEGRRVIETPQYLWMRVAVGLWGGSVTEPFHSSRSHSLTLEDRLSKIKATYDLMSHKAMTHATPTLFNSGTPRAQMSSCYLQSMKADSVEGIFDTLKDCAQISKYAGGIGLHIHNIRAAGSHIAGTNGVSDGIVPMLRVFNNTARYINQGGRRNGSIAIYLEPWHADIQAFLKLKSNTGTEEERARDLFYGLWIPDLFMTRVESGGVWSLFCPHEAPGLSDVHGDAFVTLYEKYEAEGRARATVPAQKLWSEILVSQIETGTPYLLYKDAANAKSNQQHLGTIKSSNLCVAPETLIMTSTGDYPIATLAGQTVKVWNGDRWSETTVMKTGESQKLITVVLRVIQNRVATHEMDDHIISTTTVETISITCTPYHKFILQDGTRVDAATLVPNQKLGNWKVPYELSCWSSCWEGGFSECSASVLAIHDLGRTDDTYCFNEPLNHAGVFNGVLTGNCTEIIEYSSPEETAVCNLASLALPHFVNPVCSCAPIGENERQHVDTCKYYNSAFKHGVDPLMADWKERIDFTRLHEVVHQVVENLNRVIDINFYPTPETKLSNLRHRPIGIGVQGLADMFAMLGLAWESPEAVELNRILFEHIYYAACMASCRLAAAAKETYSSYAGSPMSEGTLQPDFWGLKESEYLTAGTLDWTYLRSEIKKHGMINSLLLSPMPTASTSQILGYNECFEPFTSNIYVRRTLAGEFTIVNRYLVADLQKAGIWSVTMKDRIIAANGSIQGIPEIAADIKARYKTVWEIKQKTLIDMAADRGAFICQSHSLNLFVLEPTIAKLSSMHFYAWKKGLKTGIYYLRTKSAVQAIKFTVDPRLASASAGTTTESTECLLCSS